MNRRIGILILTGGALFAGLLGTGVALRRGVVRVPPGRIGIGGRSILEPGWRLASPLESVELVDQRGEGALPPLPVTSREGVAGQAILAFHYELELPTLRREARRRDRDFHRLLEESAGTALRESLSERSAAQFLDHAALDALLTGAITRRLGEVGLKVTDLRWEIRLPDEFRRTTLAGETRALQKRTGIRVLLIGLDAADWETIDPLLAEGRLPALKRLLDRGIRGDLRSYNPMISPLLWNTAATGKGPDLHGVADFTVREAKTGLRIPISSRYRKVKAIWNILTDLDRSSGVVAWWASHPVDHLKGCQVSDRLAALSLLPDRDRLADRPGYTYPASLLGEVLSKTVTPEQISLEEVRRFADVTPEEYAAGMRWIRHPPPAPADGKQKPPPQDPVGMLIKILAATRNYETAAARILEKGPVDFAAVYFEGIDLVGHRFQHYRPPRMGMVTEADFRKYRNVVAEFYAFQDRLLGELVAKAGSEVTVMILSDHGFKSGARRPEGVLPYTVDQPVEWHREEGIFLLSGPGASRGRLTAPVTLFDITPTLLALLGAPIASDMPGRVAEEALDPRFRAAFPPTRIPTYEGMGEPRETETDTGSDAVASEIVAQLRALGYVGGDSHAPGPGEAPAGGVEKSPPPEKEETTVTYHRNLATYLLSRREYARAIAELDEANRREKLPKTFGMLAQSYDALGRKAEALAALEAGWRDVPDGMDPDSILWYVSLAVEQGDPARGRRFLDQHRRSLENAPAVGTAAEGILAEAAGREAEAIRLYETALKADPTLVAAARPLAAAYSRAGKLEALRPVLEAGLARSERIDEYHNLLGALESQAGRKEQALDQFRRARELNPAEPRFALNLSLTLMDLERWGEAAGILESAVAATPDADLYLALGNAYLTLRRPSDALAAFRTAGDRGKDSRRADLGVTLSLRGLDRRSEALDFARRSLTRNPDNPPLQQLARDLAAGR